MFKSWLHSVRLFGNGSPATTSNPRRRKDKERVLQSNLLQLEALEDRFNPTISAAFTGGLSLVSSAPVNISKLTLDQNQPNIAVDPTNPGRMFAISNTTSGGLFGAYSTDAGQTWATRMVATGADGLPSGSTDAQLAWDNFGNLFLAYIKAGTNSTIVGLSTNGGQSFTTKLDTSTANDQPSLAVGNGMVVVAYHRAGTMRTTAASVSGLGSMGGFGLEQSVSTTGNFGNVAIGPTGQIMVTWTQALGGQGTENIYAAVDADGLGFGGFAPAVTVTSTNVGSSDAIPAQAFRHIDSEPKVAFDSLGRAYLVYTDETPDESNNTDIFIRTSDDNGATWSARKKVNDDATTLSQFLPSIAVDRDTGYVAVSWYDSRNTTSNKAQVFGTVSTDRGATFLANVNIGPGISNSANAPSSLDFGDYTGLCIAGGSFFPVWADNSNSTGDNPAGADASFDVYAARSRIASVGGQTVTLTGTSSVDAFNIKTDATGTYVLFYENNPAMTGKPSLVVTKASLQKIVINAGDSDDVVTVDFSFGNPVPAGGVDYDGGAGVDTIAAIGDKDFGLTDFQLLVSGAASINLGNVNKATLTGGAGANAFWAGGWSGVVDMNGAGGSDSYTVDVYYLYGTFNISDSGVAGTDKVFVQGTGGYVTTVTASSVSGGFGNFVTYSGVESLRVTADGVVDVVNVESTSIKTNIVGGQSTYVNVGDATGVQNILGTLHIENVNFFNRVAIYDTNDGSGRSVSLSNMGSNPDDAGGNNSSWGKISGLAPADINYQYADTLEIDIQGGSGADTFYLLSSALPGSLESTVNGGGGADQFAIYGNNYGSGGVINLNGESGDDAFFVFFPVSVGPVVTLNGGADMDKLFGHNGLVNWYINAGVGNYVDFSTNTSMGFSGFEQYRAASIQNNFYVQSTALGTKTLIVAGASNSYVIIGTAGSVQSILGTVNIENPSGFSNVVIDDSADNLSRTVSVTNFFGNPDSYAGANDLWNKVSGIAPADINVDDLDASLLTIKGGLAADTFNVTPAVHTPLYVVGGAPGFPNLLTADYLNIDTFGTNSQLFNGTANGAGNWAFGNRASLDFSGMERMSPGVSISGRVFNDLDNNGNDNAGTEPGMAGVTIGLDPTIQGVAGMQVTTAADGTFSFVNLAPCNYRVRQTVPNGYAQTTVNPADIGFNAPLANAGIKFGNHSAGDVTAPTIVGVYLDGSSWTTAFRTAAGNASYGRPAQTGASQLTTLPWSTINTVYVKFSENVAIDLNDLAVRGLNVANYTVSTLAYDNVNFVAKFTLSGVIDTDRLILDLDGDSATAVVDAAGNKLAGAWTEIVSAFPTAGAAGSDFKYRFLVAVGDADRNGLVRNADVNLVRGNLFVDAGQAGYNVFADVDGNGLVRNADVNTARSHLFVDPPAGPGPNRPGQRGSTVHRNSAGAKYVPFHPTAHTDLVDSAPAPRRLAANLSAAALDALFADV